MYKALTRVPHALLVPLLISSCLNGCNLNKLSNGNILADLSGRPETDKSFSLHLPANISGLMLEANGNENLNLSLVDPGKQVIANCYQPARCTMGALEKGDYQVVLHGGESYTNVSLTGAWAGASASTLQNNVTHTVPKMKAGSVGLDAFYVTTLHGELSLSIGGADAEKLNTEILDGSGQRIADCAATSPCSTNAVEHGVYYVRRTATADIADATITPTWGGADKATLQNGVVKSVLPIKPQQIVWESVYIPANTDGFALLPSSDIDRYLDAQIVNEKGEFLTHCDTHAPCMLQKPAEGLYYVGLQSYEYIASPSVVAAWAGSKGGTLENGGLLPDVDVLPGQQLLESFYIPANTDAFMVAASNDRDNARYAVLNAQGTMVKDCSGSREGCMLSQPAAGVYYILVDNRFGSSWDSTYTSVDVMAAWNGKMAAGLKNGVTTKLTTPSAGKMRIKSFYVPANTTGIAVMTQGEFRLGYTSVTNVDGTSVAGGCESYTPCFLTPPTSGTYFITIRYNERVSGSVTATWAGPQQSPIKSGMTQIINVAKENQYLLKAFYLPDGTSDALFSLGGYADLMVLDQNGLSHDVCNATYLPGSNSSCMVHFSDSSAGVHYLQIRMHQDQNSMSLAAAWGGPGYADLQNGITSPAFDVAPNLPAVRSIYVPANSSQLEILTSPWSWDFNCVVISSANPLSLDFCSDHYELANPAADVYFMGIKAYSNYASGISLKASY